MSVTLGIVRKKRRVLVSAWRNLNAGFKEQVIEFAIQATSVAIRADSATVEAASKWLGDIRVLANDQSAAAQGGSSDQLCDLCMCDVEPPSFHFKACGHGGCASCMEGQFQSQAELPLPVQCFSMECRKCLVPLSDVSSLAPGPSFQKIKDAAVRKFVREHPLEYRYCPNHQCDQILDLRQVVAPGTEVEEAEKGGTVAYCDQCDQKVRARGSFLCSLNVQLALLLRNAFCSHSTV